jgi:hypothetical protein
MSSVFADLKVEENKITLKTTKDEIPPYYHRVNFGLSRLGYEFIKPEFLYAGAEVWGILSYGPFPFERTMGEIEARIGYNFAVNHNDRFTPIIGIGCFKDFRHHQKQGVCYITSGVLYEHKFTNLFDLGVNLKGLLGQTEGRSRWGNPVWGYDISVPLTIHFGEYRNWDFRLEPFYIQMFGHNSTHSYGGTRSSFGYRF